MMLEHNGIAAKRSLLLLLLGLWLILIGQWDREPIPPDDQREMEIAREMFLSGDYVMPHLTGLPFVEKPPGFESLVAAAFHLTGGISPVAARLVSVGFALVTMLALFLLGRRILGMEGGALAALILVLAARFCRTAHEILLDNALIAMMSLALYFGWLGISALHPEAKRRAYAGMAFVLGLAFLVKGFVGPVLFGAGLLVFLLVRKSWSEFKPLLHPLTLAAFLVPVAFWLIPFLGRASPELVRAFFIDNHFGRFVAAFAGHSRPVYYYLLDFWVAAFPVSWLLPFALHDLWRRRQGPDGEAGLYGFAMMLGPLILLSFSRAKDSVYFLPAYPALALLLAWYLEPKLRQAADRATRIGFAVFGALALVTLMATILWTLILGGLTAMPVVTTLAGVGALIWWSGRWRAGDSRGMLLGLALLFTLAWGLWFTGPIAAWETGHFSNRALVERLLYRAQGRGLLLYRPNDNLRGGLGLAAERPAQEVDDPALLIEMLRANPKLVVILRLQQGEIPSELRQAGERSGVRFREEVRASYGPEPIEVALLSLDPAAPRLPRP